MTPFFFALSTFFKISSLFPLLSHWHRYWATFFKTNYENKVVQDNTSSWIGSGKCWWHQHLMTQCLLYCCTSCQAEHKREWAAKRKDAHQINACITGPFPAFVKDANKEEVEFASSSLKPKAGSSWAKKSWARPGQNLAWVGFLPGFWKSQSPWLGPGLCRYYISILYYNLYYNFVGLLGHKWQVTEGQVWCATCHLISSPHPLQMLHASHKPWPPLYGHLWPYWLSGINRNQGDRKGIPQYGVLAK